MKAVKVKEFLSEILVFDEYNVYLEKKSSNRTFEIDFKKKEVHNINANGRRKTG
ncbi:MAG: hypothetical protein ACI4VM_03995 [Anaerovoracaceae bacterium]